MARFLKITSSLPQAKTMTEQTGVKGVTQERKVLEVMNRL